MKILLRPLGLYAKRGKFGGDERPLKEMALQANCETIGLDPSET